MKDRITGARKSKQLQCAPYWDLDNNNEGYCRFYKHSGGVHWCEQHNIECPYKGRYEIMHPKFDEEKFRSDKAYKGDEKRPRTKNASAPFGRRGTKNG